MLSSLEKILRKNMKDAGVDHKKFEIGGYERGTYGLGAVLRHHARVICFLV